MTGCVVDDYTINIVSGFTKIPQHIDLSKVEILYGSWSEIQISSLSARISYGNVIQIYSSTKLSNLNAILGNGKCVQIRFNGSVSY